MKTNTIRKTLSVLLASAFCLTAGAEEQSTAAKSTGEVTMGPWVFGYWVGHKGRPRVTSMHYAWSRDGLNWTVLNGGKPVLDPTVGMKTLRDFHIGRGADGMFHLLAPDLKEMLRGTRAIIHYRSKDLINWEPPKLVPVGPEGPAFRCLWGPEFLYDEKEKNYVVWWSCPNTAGAQKKLNCRIWYARTEDFSSYTKPKILFDPGYMSIDATMIQAKGQFYLVYKDNRKDPKDNPPKGGIHVVQVAKGPTIEGPFQVIAPNISREYSDGPTVIQVAESRWLMLYEGYQDKGYFASESTDMENWKPVPKEKTRFPFNSRHGTIFPVTEKELQALIARYPSPAAEKKNP